MEMVVLCQRKYGLEESRGEMEVGVGFVDIEVDIQHIVQVWSGHIQIWTHYYKTQEQDNFYCNQIALKQMLTVCEMRQCIVFDVRCLCRVALRRTRER